MTHVWANNTVFLDFFSDDSAQVWNAGLAALYDLVPYDGLWLDMNEIGAMCDGECPDYNGTETTSSASSRRSLKEVTQSSLDSDSTWYTSYSEQDEMSTFKLPFMPG